VLGKQCECYFLEMGGIDAKGHQKPPVQGNLPVAVASVCHG